MLFSFLMHRFWISLSIAIIFSINGLSPKPRKVLQLFRLRQINNATFIKVNKATQNMLRLIEPFVTYGYVCDMCAALILSCFRFNWIRFDLYLTNLTLFKLIFVLILCFSSCAVPRP